MHCGWTQQLQQDRHAASRAAAGLHLGSTSWEGRLCQSTGLTAQDGHVRSASVQSAQGSGSSSASANPTQAVSSDELLPWKQCCCSASIGTSRDTASQKPGLMTHLSAPLFHQQLPAYATVSTALGLSSTAASASAQDKRAGIETLHTHAYFTGTTSQARSIQTADWAGPTGRCWPARCSPTQARALTVCLLQPLRPDLCLGKGCRSGAPCCGGCPSAPPQTAIHLHAALLLPLQD